MVTDLEILPALLAWESKTGTVVIPETRLKSVGRAPNSVGEEGAVGWDCARSVEWPATGKQSVCSHILSMEPVNLERQLVFEVGVFGVDRDARQASGPVREIPHKGAGFRVLCLAPSAMYVLRLHAGDSTDLLITFCFCFCAMHACNGHAFGGRVHCGGSGRTQRGVS